MKCNTKRADGRRLTGTSRCQSHGGYGHAWNMVRRTHRFLLFVVLHHQWRFDGAGKGRLLSPFAPLLQGLWAGILFVIAAAPCALALFLFPARFAVGRRCLPSLCAAPLAVG